MYPFDFSDVKNISVNFFKSIRLPRVVYFWWNTQHNHFCVVFLNWWLFTKSSLDKNKRLFITSRQIMNPATDRLFEKAQAGDWNPEEIKRSNLMWLDAHQKLLFDHNTHCPFPQTKMGYRSVRIEACRHLMNSNDFPNLPKVFSLKPQA